MVVDVVRIAEMSGLFFFANPGGDQSVTMVTGVALFALSLLFFGLDLGAVEDV